MMVIIVVGIIDVSDQHGFVIDTITAGMDLMKLIVVSIPYLVLCTVVKR